jgi:hypothetical protein
VVIRPSLIIGPPHPALVATLEQLAIEVVRAIDQRADAAPLLAQIHALTDNPWYDEPFFRTLHSRNSPEEFAELAALGNPPTIPDLTRDEIVELIRLASKPEKPYQDYYLHFLDRNLPNAGISDLIFWGDRERTPEGMADEALFRCTLYRKGGIDAVRARLVELADEVRANPAAPPWAEQWADHYKR